MFHQSIYHWDPTNMSSPDGRKADYLAMYKQYFNMIINIDDMDQQIKQLKYASALIKKDIETIGCKFPSRPPPLQRSNAHQEPIDPFTRYCQITTMNEFVNAVISVISNDRYTIALKNDILKIAMTTYYEYCHAKNTSDVIHVYSSPFDENFFSEKLTYMLINVLKDIKNMDTFCKIIQYNVLNDDGSLCFDRALYNQYKYYEHESFSLNKFYLAIKDSHPHVSLWTTLLVCIHFNRDLDLEEPYPTNIRDWIESHYRSIYGPMYDRFFHPHSIVNSPEKELFVNATKNFVEQITSVLHMFAFARRKHLLAICSF